MKKSIKRIKTKSNKNLKRKSRTRKQKKIARKTRKMRGGMTSVNEILEDDRLNGPFMELVDARKTQLADTNDAQSPDYEDATEIVNKSPQKIADLINENKSEEEKVTSDDVLRLVKENIESGLKTPVENKRLNDDEPSAPRKKYRREDTQQELSADDYINIDDNFTDRILDNYGRK